MLKKLLLATLLVFVSWELLDYLIHGVILMPTYMATQNLWRPVEEMKNGLMMVVTAISAVAFTYIYARLVGVRSVGTGLKYGFWFGLSAGVSMGYGTYAVMPIPYHLALAWFVGVLVEMMVGGLLAGLVLKEAAPLAQAAA